MRVILDIKILDKEVKSIGQALNSFEILPAQINCNYEFKLNDMVFLADEAETVYLEAVK